MKRWQSLLLGVVISVITLAYALHGNNLQKLGVEFARGRYLFLIPAVLTITASLWLRAVRWRVILSDRLSLSHSFHILNASYFLGTWLPFRLGEVVRSYMTTRVEPPIPMITSLSSIVVERLIDLLVVAVLLALSLTTVKVDPQIETAGKITGIVAAIGIIGLILVASQPRLVHWMVERVLKILPYLERFKLRQLTDRVLDGFAPLRSPVRFTLLIFWTALSWIGSLVASYFLMYIYYDTPNWWVNTLAIASASLAVAIPAVPGSVGPFEFMVLLSMNSGMIDINNPEERAVAFAVVLHGVTVGMYAVLGVIGLAQEKMSLSEVVQSIRNAASGKQNSTIPENI